MSEHSGAASISEREGRVAARLVALKRMAQKMQHMLLEKNGSRKPAPFGQRVEKPRIRAETEKDGRENPRVFRNRKGRVEKTVLPGNLKRADRANPCLFGSRKKMRRAKTRAFCGRKKDGFQNRKKKTR